MDETIYSRGGGEREGEGMGGEGRGDSGESDRQNIMVWVWSVPQKLMCEIIQEDSEEKWLSCESELISELISW